MNIDDQVAETVAQLKAVDSLIGQYYHETPISEYNKSWISQLYCWVFVSGHIPTLTEVLNLALSKTISDAVLRAPRYKQTGGSLFASDGDYVLIQTRAHETKPEWTAVVESIKFTEDKIVQDLKVKTALDLDPEHKMATLAFAPADADFSTALQTTEQKLMWWRHKLWIKIT